jgi:secreted trypsin-like serine protease
MYRHQQFDPQTYDFDVAVVQTQDPIRYTAVSRPIQLADKGLELPAGTACLVAGYGDTGTDLWPRPLAWTKVYLQDYQRCKSIYERLGRTKGYTFMVTNNTICANDPSKRSDACQGDSGGALVCKGRVYGIVSHGYGCAEPKYPGVYTKLPTVRDWIKRWTNI